MTAVSSTRAADLRTFIDASRDRLLDTVDWLLALDEETFRKHVADDVYGKADADIAKALRHTKLRSRWILGLAALREDVKHQLKTVLPHERADYDEWRKRADYFRLSIHSRDLEARALNATSAREGQTPAGAAKREQRQSVRDQAITRLIEAHRAEFTALLAEEYREAGIEVPDGVYRQLRELTGDGAT